MGTNRRDFSVLTDASGIPYNASAEGFADFIGVSPRAIRYMAAKGTIPAVKVGRAWRINLPEALKVLGLYPGQVTDSANQPETAE